MAGGPQLWHVRSGKYVTVSHSETAKVERENLRVFLNEGSSLSWLQLLPRFKIDREVRAEGIGQRMGVRRSLEGMGGGSELPTSHSGESE
jgi:hypothetical protein